MEKVRKQVMKNKNGRNNKEQHENNIKKKKIESLSQDFFYTQYHVIYTEEQF